MRLMARQRAAIAAGEHTKPLVDPFAQLFWTEHLHPRSGQLDRQRNAVQPPADVGDNRRVLVGQCKSVNDAARTLDEQRSAGYARRRDGE